jgi:hypothetical protein
MCPRRPIASRIGTLVAIASGAFALGFLAFPSTWAAGQAATEDSVTGALYVSPEPCFPRPDPPFIECTFRDRYTFDAHSGPTGENARGEVVFATGERVGFMFDRGDVTCLAVSGKRASIGVNFQGLSQGPGEPHSAILFVEDIGGEGLDKFAIQDLAPGITAPTVCPGELPAGLQLGPTYPRMFTDDGTVTVTDAPNPLPTSKEQCKNGGYAAFNFKNQGECVAFVQRGPKP